MFVGTLLKKTQLTTKLLSLYYSHNWHTVILCVLYLS